MNFVIDEASDTRKGANTVVSMLDFFSWRRRNSEYCCRVCGHRHLRTSPPLSLRKGSLSSDASISFKGYESIAGKMLAIASALTQLHHHMNPWLPSLRHSPSGVEFDYLLFVVCLLVCNLFCSCVYMWWVHSPSIVD